MGLGLYNKQVKAFDEWPQWMFQESKQWINERQHFVRRMAFTVWENWKGSCDAVCNYKMPWPLLVLSKIDATIAEYKGVLKLQFNVPACRMKI